MRTVAVDILTGFLGSGKTTLLRHALEHGLRGKPVAIIMNEIGDIGIDGPVLTGFSAVEKMVELSSGCICCTIDEYRFDLAIQEILAAVHPHVLVIETTGLADPAALVERVRAAGLGVDAIITVVDAANLDRHCANSRVARRQIAAADFVVMNKIDLVDERQLARVERQVRRIAPRAERFRSVHGAVDSDLLFATGVATWRERARAGGERHKHLHEDGIGSFVWRSAAPVDEAGFERLLLRLPSDILRAKGIVRFAGREWQCLCNFTCGRHDLTWIKLPEWQESQMVFIGRRLERHRPRIEAALTGCLREPASYEATGG